MPVLNKFQYNVCVSWNVSSVTHNRPDIQNLHVKGKNLKSN